MANEPPPVAIVGAGPIGLTTALAMAYYGVRTVVYEDDMKLSTDTKAGTLLSRTLEILRRYGVAEEVLSQALRVDEIGEIDRRSQQPTFPVLLHVLTDETRYPFVINIPQHDLEPILADGVARSGFVEVKMGHRVLAYEDSADGVTLQVETEDRIEAHRASFLLACDGGRSTMRDKMGISVEGHTLPIKYALIDLELDLDVENPRDYPYLAYFSDAVEWMILVRQPHCWRFLYPLAEGSAEPTDAELREKSLTFIGQVRNVKVLQKIVYQVHHRVATSWRRGHAILMGDAAHLITPMWALGLNTGALDASNLPWRLAWLLRGWATDSVLDGYEREQRPLAIQGSGEMAEQARLTMSRNTDATTAMTANNWCNAHTRTMLGVRLDVHGNNEWSIVTRETRPAVTEGSRLPDYLIHTPDGNELRIHDLCSGHFTALYFTDVRRRPAVPKHSSFALRHYAVSRFDAPLDSGIRDRSLLDPGNALFIRLGIAPNTMLLVRPDEHIAAIVPMVVGGPTADQLYESVTGLPPPADRRE